MVGNIPKWKRKKESIHKVHRCISYYKKRHLEGVFCGMMMFLNGPLSMDDADKLSLSSDIFKNQIQASPIHTFILRVDLREVIFHDFFAGIDVEDIVDDIPSFKFLIMVDFRSIYEVYVVDEFFPVMAYS